MSVYDQIRCILVGIRCREAALLLISAAVLSYQVILVRAFSIGQWHHFAYMVISIALLGFDASGAGRTAPYRCMAPKRAELDPNVPELLRGEFLSLCIALCTNLPSGAASIADGCAKVIQRETL